MKYEWRKKEKNIYLPKSEPTITEIPTMRYLMLEGEGNPNSHGFKECVEALYAVSYGIKMSPKNGYVIEGFYDYTVFPLEGVWGLTDEGIKKQKEGTIITELKDYFTFQVMIRQPEFVSNNVLSDVLNKVKKKKSENTRINDVKLVEMIDGLVCQMMHVGSYDDEPASFKLMEEYCQNNGYHRIAKTHREIYLSDPKRVAPEKLKTTIRFLVEKT